MSHFTKHVRQAIVLNRSRWRHYKEIMATTSSKEKAKILDDVFKTLIRSEQLTLLFSWFYDWRCPVGMSQSFEDIALNPTFATSPDTRFTNGLETIDFKKFEIALTNRNIHLLNECLQESISRLPNQKHNCMLRHLFESMRRAAWVYENGQLPPREKNTYWQYCKGHSLFFKAANDLDYLAFEIQKDGPDILAAELPHIPQSPK